MQTIAEQDEASLRRMEWRCRRGMLELDLLFTPFVKKHLPNLNQAQIAALDDLLDLPDNVLWALLSKQQQNHAPAKKQVLDMLASS
ncbi:MAG: succinate dehydrogenase assembly factor 2 [Methylophilaceae bacterium]|jgi:antitoxin CptB|nr:succinate dehydrogenase assembly factor 2 [Methyloradius sp.]